MASWTKPQEGVESIEPTRALSKAAGDDGSTKRDAGAETLSQPTDARTQWTESIDEASGQPYYYNVMTVRSDEYDCSVVEHLSITPCNFILQPASMIKHAVLA